MMKMTFWNFYSGEARDECGSEDRGQTETSDGGEQEADPPGDKSRSTSGLA